ncbi:MAG TPA: prenyltransferase/squalene oxidase repeat-containing protein, partial [Planctomycetota bacterium]|nr:prenyltransferase/squalene oxidase repeat-containing protein [Planctomycetota bacterium]
MATFDAAYSRGQKEDLDFNEVLVEQLRRTPWFLLSVVLHLVLLMLMHLFSKPYEQKKVDDLVITASAQPEVVEEEPPPPVPEETKEIQPDEVVTEEPVIKDTEISDHNETDNNEEWEESKGEDQLSDKPFDGTNSNDAIGMGGGAGGAFGGRRGGKRNLKAGGGGRTQSVVDAGLEWLKNHQSPEGNWDCDNFMAMCDPKKGAPCDGKGQAGNDVGVSGLALLAFLGAGHTHREGAFKETVRKGLSWMKSKQDSEGCFGERGHHFTYNHGIAALAMAEAYGMTTTPIWKQSAQKGINFIISAQNPYKAWRYDVRPGDNDVSVTGWMVMALKSAKMAELEVSDEPIKNAHEFVKEMTDEENGRTGYMKKGERPVRPEG